MFLFAGILINWVPVVSYNILRQEIVGISHLLTIVRNTGTVFSSWIDNVPSIMVPYLQVGILTATLNSALSFFFILKWT